MCCGAFPSDINAGEGLLLLSRAKWARIAPCPINTYGVQARTYNLQASPCRPCSPNLRTDPLINNTGWTNPSACYNLAGWGWSAQGLITECPEGTFNPERSLSSCKKCGSNRYTIDGSQRGKEDCLVMPGYGIVYANQSWVSSDSAGVMAASTAADLEVIECPATHYGPGGQVNSTCVPCNGGHVGDFPGATSSSDCNCKYAWTLGLIDCLHDELLGVSARLCIRFLNVLN